MDRTAPAHERRPVAVIIFSTIGGSVAALSAGAGTTVLGPPFWRKADILLKIKVS